MLHFKLSTDFCDCLGFFCPKFVQELFVTGQCQDTLATIAEPVTHNTYGKNQGAWMKDPKSNADKIYVADDYYGNTLLEFQNMEVFKQGRGQ